MGRVSEPTSAGSARVASVPSRAELEAVARDLPFPEAIVGTRSESSCDWLRGDDRDINHLQWQLEEDNAADRLRNARFLFDLGSVVDAGGVRLSAPGRLLDQHTKRVAGIALLNGRLGRRRAGPKSVWHFGHAFDWYVRWRLSVGVERNAEVSEARFLDYLDRASRRGSLDLVPIDARIAALISTPGIRGKDGELLPMTLSEVAAELGVTAVGISKSPWAMAELKEGLGSRFKRKRDTEDGGTTEDHAPVRSARGVNDALDCWQTLAKLSAIGTLHLDPLGVDPFTQRTPLSYARQHGDDTGKRGAMPPMAMLRLMDAAAKWQLDWGPSILDAADWLRDGQGALSPSYVGQPGESRVRESVDFMARLPKGMPPILLAWNTSAGKFADPRLPSCITLAEAVGHFLTAGLLLFEAFGMLSADDALSAKAGCVEERVTGLRELHLSSQGFRAVEAVPVPAMLGVVHDNLARLTAPSVGEDGIHWLFRVLRPGFGAWPHMRFPAHGYLAAFCEINGIEHGDAEAGWLLTGAEPRRGMAVWYHYGNTAGSLDALSRLVGHYDPERTRIWVHGLLPGRVGELHNEMLARHAAAGERLSDEEKEWRATARETVAAGRRRGEVFEAVRREAVASVALRVAEGFESPGGSGGRALRAEMDALKELAETDVRLGARGNDPGLARKALLQRVEAYAKDHFLWPVPGGPAHCRFQPGRPQDVARAECLRIKAERGRSSGAPWVADDDVASFPDHAFSGFVPCLKCVHAVVMSENRAKAAAEASRLGRAVELASSPTSAAAAQQLLDELVSAVNAAEAVGNPGDT